MARSVKEWIGKTDDAKVPPRVRLRIFEREHGICHLTKTKIQVGDLWDLDHKIALINKGQHRESNLFPALRWAHKEKNKADVAEKAQVNHTRARHVGADKEKPEKPPKRLTKVSAGVSEIARRYGL